MKDTLLWKLGWAPQTVQITLLGSTGKYPAYYRGDSVYLSESNLQFSARLMESYSALSRSQSADSELL